MRPTLLVIFLFALDYATWLLAFDYATQQGGTP